MRGWIKPMRFYIRHNVGNSKYTVNFHDGKSKHRDGSDFFEIRIFNNKRKCARYVKALRVNGYVEI